MYPIISFEGPSGSGKSTLGGKLKEEAHPVVNEYVYYAKGHENFPPFLSYNHKQLAETIEYFVNLEIERNKDIQAALTKYGYCFVDRSPLTFTSIQFALGKKYNDVYTDFTFVKKRFLEVANEGRIVLPTHYILIESPVPLILERLKYRNSVEPFFLDPTFIKNLYLFYKSYLCKSDMILKTQELEEMKNIALKYLKLVMNFK